MPGGRRPSKRCDDSGGGNRSAPRRAASRARSRRRRRRRRRGCRPPVTCETTQSKLTTAPSSTGAPVSSTRQSPSTNRSSTRWPFAPAKSGESASWAAASVLTQSTPFALTSPCISPPRLRQTSSVGGSSVTLQTAEAVQPPRPAGPAVVTTVTAAPSRAIASRNISCPTILAPPRWGSDSCGQEGGAVHRGRRLAVLSGTDDHQETASVPRPDAGAEDCAAGLPRRTGPQAGAFRAAGGAGGGRGRARCAAGAAGGRYRSRDTEPARGGDGGAGTGGNSGRCRPGSRTVP